jgi:hypothetical protein
MFINWVYYLFGYDDKEADEKQKRQKYLVTEQIKKSKVKLKKTIEEY